MKQSPDKKISPGKDLIVITGCDSGMGRSLAALMLQKGYPVALSYLEAPPFKKRPNLYQQKLDLRIPHEVEGFCLFIKKLCGSGNPDTHGFRLAALYCNAGIALAGPVENTPLSMYRENFEVNYFSNVRIIQALIPELIQSKGKILINGSLAGKIALPFLSPYASSKFALEGFCDSLRREMKPFDVQTVLIESASVATPIWNKSYNQDISFIEEKYIPTLRRFQKMLTTSGNKGLSSEKSAVLTAAIIEDPRPKTRYVIAKGKINSKYLRFLPDAALDRLLLRHFKINYGNMRMGRRK